MLQQVYSIRDQKSNSFGPPFVATTHGEAERNFERLCRDEKTLIAQYPKDFDLYHLGSWSTEDGKFDPLDAPYHLMQAIQLVKMPSPVEDLRS